MTVAPMLVVFAMLLVRLLYDDGPAPRRNGHTSSCINVLCLWLAIRHREGVATEAMTMMPVLRNHLASHASHGHLSAYGHLTAHGHTHLPTIGRCDAHRQSSRVGRALHPLHSWHHATTVLRSTIRASVAAV